MNKRCELQFFRWHCEGYSCDTSASSVQVKELELAFRLEFLLLFVQAKSKNKNNFNKRNYTLSSNSVAEALSLLTNIEF
jgi:hypothetical protein